MLLCYTYMLFSSHFWNIFYLANFHLTTGFSRGCNTFPNCSPRVSAHLYRPLAIARARAHISTFTDGTCSTPEACACRWCGPHEFRSQLHFARPCKRVYSPASANRSDSTLTPASFDLWIFIVCAHALSIALASKIIWITCSESGASIILLKSIIYWRSYISSINYSYNRKNIFI